MLIWLVVGLGSKGSDVGCDDVKVEGILVGVAHRERLSGVIGEVIVDVDVSSAE